MHEIKKLRTRKIAMRTAITTSPCFYDYLAAATLFRRHLFRHKFSMFIYDNALYNNSFFLIST